MIEQEPFPSSCPDKNQETTTTTTTKKKEQQEHRFKAAKNNYNKRSGPRTHNAVDSRLNAEQQSRLGNRGAELFQEVDKEDEGTSVVAGSDDQVNKASCQKERGENSQLSQQSYGACRLQRTRALNSPKTASTITESYLKLVRL